MLGLPIWGIFDSNGLPVLLGDSVFGLEVVHESKISDAPQERGAFESYNKVSIPFNAKLTYLVSGTELRRGAFIAQCERLRDSLDLVTVVMPEFQYLSANVTHYEFRRVAAAGAQLLKVDVWCQEVRIVSSGRLTNTKSVNGAETQNNGTTVPQDERALQGDVDVGMAEIVGVDGQAVPQSSTNGNFRLQGYEKGTQAQKQTVIGTGTTTGADKAKVSGPISPEGDLTVLYGP